MNKEEIKKYKSLFWSSTIGSLISSAITIYSKIVTAYCICTIPFLLLSLYLYNKLPAYIPSKIGIGGVYSWFRKEFVFLLPVLFLIIGILFSKKGIIKQFYTGTPAIFIKSLGLIVLLLVLFSTIYLYYSYFSMI